MLKVRPVNRADKAEWLRMRGDLWPASREDHESEIDVRLSDPGPQGIVFVAEREDGRLGGFLEAGTRSYAEGCTSSPVAYIEGWWVDPDLRRSGVGAQLIAVAEAWARSRGFVEIASDSELTNERSQLAHRALGYHETERLVCFRKRL